MNGFLITLEGAEGCGKSTQAAALGEFLQAQGYDVLLTREPGAGEIGRQIRALILDPANTTLNDRAEAFLYAADRAQHVTEVLLPALKAGKIVVCDRYTDSFLAYQGYGRGLDLQFLQQLNELATAGLQPNLTILLAISPQAGMERVKKRGQVDRIEAEALDFHARLGAGYLQIAAQNPERVLTIDANRSIEEISAEIAAQVRARLSVANR